MCLKIIDVLNTHRPDIIVIEKLSVSRNMISLRALCKIMGAVYCYCILKNIFYFEIQPSQWRSKLGMQKANRKRDEYKELSIQYVRDKYGLNVTDDIADAICIGEGYIKMFT